MKFSKFFVNTFIHTRAKSSSKHSKNPKKFIDWKRLKVKAGNGGNGCVSFRRERYLPWGGPNGGDGGSGGDVVLMATPSISSMKSIRYNYKAGNGGNGEGMERKGGNGKDAIIKVPLGTVVKESGYVIADLATKDSRYVVAAGGEGGMGNICFTTPEHKSPKEATDGLEGEEKVIEIELKIIADIGMVGFPNAGKSTLLRCVSKAMPKIGSYPFTTLNPNIGVIDTLHNTKLSIADIPGILPGAHDNVGLGHSFLRHIERCQSLLYVLDPCSNMLPDKLVPDSLLTSMQNNGNYLYKQLTFLQNELLMYDKKLLNKQQIIVVNKMDHDGTEEMVRELNKQTDLMIIPVSGLYRLNIEYLINILCNNYKN